MPRLRREETPGTDKAVEHISSMELCKRTGASYRQIDYWCRGDVFKPSNGHNSPGSGNPREFDASIVPAVKLLVRVSQRFHSLIRLETLKIIFDNYENGKVDFEDLTLIWVE